VAATRLGEMKSAHVAAASNIKSVTGNQFDMDVETVTTDCAAACLRLLQSAMRPLPAVEIARRLELTGSRETQRRHVRAIIKLLRDNGSRIVATLDDGYLLTDDEKMWREYLDGKQIDAKRILAQTHKEKRMLSDANGQGILFRPVCTTGLG